MLISAFALLLVLLLVPARMAGVACQRSGWCNQQHHHLAVLLGELPVWHLQQKLELSFLSLSHTTSWVQVVAVS
jgi:hypothetical protein